MVRMLSLGRPVLPYDIVIVSSFQAIESIGSCAATPEHALTWPMADDDATAPRVM